VPQSCDIEPFYFYIFNGFFGHFVKIIFKFRIFFLRGLKSFLCNGKIHNGNHKNEYRQREKEMERHKQIRGSKNVNE